MSIVNRAAGQENDSDAAISFIRLLLTNGGNTARQGAVMDFFMSGLLVFSRFPSLCSRGPPERALAEPKNRCKAKRLRAAAPLSQRENGCRGWSSRQSVFLFFARMSILETCSSS